MKPIFRNAMFGFHKEDVAKFIASQSKQQERVVSELNREREELIREYEDRIMSLQMASDELDRLRGLEEKVLSLYADISQKYEESSVLTEQVKSSLDVNDAAISELEKENAELVERIKRDSVFREKAKKFDQLSCVLSGIVNGKPLEASEINVDDVPCETDVELKPAFDCGKLRSDLDELIRFYQDISKLLADFSEK